MLTIGLLFLSAELGYRVGRRRRSRYTEEGKKITGIILGAALGMLAFLLAFTFGMAGSVNRERKQLVLEEANAIGTAYLRAQLLPKKQCAEIQTLLHKYVDIRASIRKVKRVEDLKPILARSEEVHDQLWTHSIDLVDDNSEPIFVGLFAESLNNEAFRLTLSKIQMHHEKPLNRHPRTSPGITNFVSHRSSMKHNSRYRWASKNVEYLGHHKR